MTSFRCPAVDRCESRNIELTCVRSSVFGPSSGIWIHGDEILDVVDALETKVCAEDLRETAAEVLVDLAVDARAGILSLFRLSRCDAGLGDQER